MNDLSARLSRLSPEKRSLLEQRLSGKAAAVPVIPRRAAEEAAPLSFSQRRLWFLEQLTPGTAAYNAPYAFQGSGTLDVEAFRRAVDLVIERHSVLRTAIGASASGEPVGKAAAAWEPASVVECSSQEEARRAIAEAAQRPFDLSRAPLVRTTVVLYGPGAFLLLFTAHHIAWDGFSKGIFFRELAALYEGAELPPLPIEYADYALWQERIFTGAAREKEVAYWRAQLAGAPGFLDIPLDKPRPAVQRFQGAKIPFVLPAPLLDAVKALSRAEKTTAYTTLLAAFKIFLLAFTGQQDIAVLTPFAGRDEAETQALIGFFINTVVLRTKVEGTASFVEIIGRVRETVLGAQENQRMPMDQLIEILGAPRDPTRMPLSQVNFRLQAGKPPELRLRGVELAPLPLIDTFISKFDLALEVASAEGEAGYLEYNTDLFDEYRMKRIPEVYETLVGELIANPNTPVSELPAFQAAAQLRPKRRRLPAAKSKAHD